MSITIDCSVSLSKKLRPLVDERGSVTLVVHNIVNGKGQGKLSLTSDSQHDITPEDIGETSIMLEPVAIAEEVPGNIKFGVSSIFSTVDTAQEDLPEIQPISRLARTKAPEKEEVARAISAPKTPPAFRETDDPEYKEYIGNLADLTSAISIARTKSVAEVNLDGLNERQKAIRMEEIERAEGIGVPAWVVNDKAATLSINDLGISLLLNAPFDLSNISAKRIAESSDLKSMMKAGYVKFIAPNELRDYIQRAKDSEATVPSLDVFDSAENAFDHMVGQATPGRSSQPLIDEENMMMVGEEDANSPTEEEELMSLTGIPQRHTTQGGVRSSSHGSGHSTTRRGKTEPSEAPKGVVSIRRKE